MPAGCYKHFAATRLRR